MKKELSFILCTVLIISAVLGYSLPVNAENIQEETVYNFDESKMTGIKSESELKRIASSYGNIGMWGYADYDGNGIYEAFAVIGTCDAYHGKDVKINKVVFVNGYGNVSVIINDIDRYAYFSNAGCIRYCDGKGFFWFDYGAYGSSYLTVLLSVKNEKPYELNLSRKIQGFYQDESGFYHLKNDWSKGYHDYAKARLSYDRITQQFILDDSIVYDGYTFKKSSDGTMRCYDSAGNLVINQFKCDGVYTYFFQADGTAMKDRLTYHPDGVHVIYFDDQGHEVFSNFANVKKTISGDAVNDFCFFDTFGYLYVDVLTYDQAGQNIYYANPYGVMEVNKWFQFSNSVMWADNTPANGHKNQYGYAQYDGTLLRNSWTYDWEGRWCYMQGNGVAAY